MNKPGGGGKLKLGGGGGGGGSAKYERGGGGGGGFAGGPHIHYWMALLLRRFHPALSSTCGRGTSLSPARGCGGAL